MATRNLQQYDCFLVLDFEATCQEGNKIPNQEVIEFPVLKLDGNSFDITDLFHKYVRPVHNPQLTDFCTKLTGITQEMVEESKPFPVVFDLFKIWMEEKVGLDKKFLFVTCGDWDLKSMLPEQCQLDNLEVPSYCKSWLNIKKAYADQTGTFLKGIMPMLEALKLKHVGRLHSGIDDCNNIAHILKALADLGCVFEPTSSLKGRTPHQSGTFESLKSDRKNFHSQPSEAPLDFNTDSFPPLNSSSFPPLNSKPIYSQTAIYPSLLDWNVSQPPSLSSNINVNSGNVEGRRDPYLDDLREEHRDDLRDDSRMEHDNEVTQSPGSFLDQTPIKYDVIMNELKENFSHPRFDKRNRAELKTLLSSGKYLSEMKEEDRSIVEARLRFYYVGLCHGWKTASNDTKALSTASVGIEVSSAEGHSRQKRLHRHDKRRSAR